MRKVVIGDCELYCGDCLEVLPNLEKSHLIVTSPPYDSLRTYEGKVFNWLPVVSALPPNLEDGGVIVWNVADAVVGGSETGTSFKQALTFMESGLRLHDTMIYCKDGCPFPDPTRYVQAHEYMFVFSKGRPKNFNGIKDKPNKWAGTETHGTRRESDGSLKGIKRKKVTPAFGLRHNWWVIHHKPSPKNPHPASMPYEMARGHIETWSNEGDTVLDPMMGSGTTGVACVKMGRKFIGIELEEKYFQTACTRIEEAYAQPSMFPANPIEKE